MKKEIHLPEKWAETSLDEISDSISTSGKKIKTKDALSFGAYPVIDQGVASISGYVNDPSLVVSASHENPIVIFGDHTRVVKYVNKDFVPGADGTKLLRPKKGIYSRYFKYLIQNTDIPDRGYGRHYQFLKDANLPLAPEFEQRRIADKLDTILTRVDALNDRLARITPLLKRFRQSVLAAATSGRLTEDCAFGGVKRCLLKNIIKVSSGDGLIAKNMNSEGGIPVYGGNGVNGYHDKYNVYEPTIVIGRVGYYCGSVHLTPVHAWVTDNALKVNFNSEIIDKKFLYYSLLGTNLRENISSTAQPVISGQKIYSLVFRLPSYEEQTEIVRRVEILFAYADRLEARLQTARTAAERLTPALLAKAFRGELVPQDPNDEPATELLRRLREARATQAPAKTARGRKAQVA